MKIRKKIDASNTFVLAVIFFLIFLVYGKSLFHPFLHDDYAFIVNNPQIQNLSFSSIFLKPASPAGQNFVNAYYRPLLELIYRLEYKLFRLDAMGYHLINLVIHFLNTLLVFRVVSRILGWYRSSLSASSREIAFLVALVFGLHPVQAEAVNIIAGISNLLCAFFLLMSFEKFCVYCESFQSNIKSLIVSLFLAFLALLTKEQAVILPLLVGLTAVILKKNETRINGRRIFFAVASFAAVLLFYLALRWAILGKMSVGIKWDYEFWLRILSIPGTLMMYLKILFFPVDLHYYRNTDILQDPWGGIVFAGILFLGLVLWLRKTKRSLRDPVLWGVGWFLITLLPVMNIIPMVNEYSFILTSDHFLYLPIIGIATILFVSLFQLISLQRVNNHLPLCAFGICLAVGTLSFLTLRQSAFYRSEIALFENMLRYEPQFGRGRILLGKAYYMQGSYEKAIEENQKAIKIMMRYVNQVGNTSVRSFYLGLIKGCYFDMAHSFEGLKDYPEALKSYYEATKIDPDDHVLQNNIGVVYMKMGKISKAVEAFERSLQLRPNQMAKENLYHAKMIKQQTQ